MRRIGSPITWRTYLALARLVGARRHVDGRGNSVALTFDDGPDPESTPRILDILAAHEATATFFCVGRLARKYPEVVRRIDAEGHAIGSHSETHRVGGLPPAAVLRDYAAGRESLEQVVGRSVPLFRPPHGWLEWRTARGLRRMQMDTWLWDVDPQDYAPGTDTTEIVEVAGGCEPGGIVLLHDGLEEAVSGAPPRSVTRGALPTVLARLHLQQLRTGPLA